MYYDERPGRPSNSMGKGTPDGQGVGVLKEEAQPPDPGVLGVPPTNGTPSTSVSVSGEWLVVSKSGGLEWQVDVFHNEGAARSYFRIMSMTESCWFCYVLEKDL